MATRKAEPGQERPVKMGDLLLARVAPEDASAYRPEMLAKAAELAEKAVFGHHRDESIVQIDRDSGVERHGRPVTLITMVNDNRPFLFDSVMGAVTNIAGEALLVAHPVLVVRHGDDGVEEVLGDGGIAREAGADRLSVIHVHVRALTDDEAEALAGQLAHVLAQVRAATSEWRPMLARLDHAISDFRYAPIALDQDAVTEGIAFLEWLRDDNFTFLGMREFTYSDGALERAEKRGMGILADPDVRVLRREGNEDGTSTPEIRAFLHGPEPLIVTKANARSVVHRRAYLDYVGVKTFHADGSLAGELRIVGLFTSTAYTRSVMRIPYLRSKAQAIIRKLGFNPADHNGKALINVLESYPRDELFQVPVPVLRKHAEAILALVERPRVRALVRIDQFDRFVSVLTYVPRDRYDSIVREKIGAHLRTVFEGRLSAYYPAFPEGSLARVHFIIGRSGGKTPKVDPAAIEAAIRDIIRTWEDGLRDEAAALGFDETLAAMAARFPESYRGSFAAREALADAARIADLTQENPIALDFYRRASDASKQAALKIYHHGAPVPLSRRVPMLENIGFRVISERTFEVANGGGAAVFIHDMELASAFDRPLDLQDGGKLFEEIVLCVWKGASEDDRYNALAHTAKLNARQIAVLRAYGRYLQQAGIPQSQGDIAAVLNRFPETARDLWLAFEATFDPHAQDGAVHAAKLKAKVTDALQDVPNIDDDTIIRRYLNLVDASLRTNFFALEGSGSAASLAIKLDSDRVDGLPEPKPWREIFVYGPEVEGVHLRFGPVARGGLRWSDRAQDYRTEVLGLVKAQQVKNAVIVPVGAKGGFYPKRIPAGGARDVVFEAGRQAYVNFVSSMLSITDNIEGDRVMTPEGVARLDGDDPYFVVAADKGTATFSDTANAISQAHGFWLDDAFASGGSAGYDHKKMGITARGAWEAVKRHFREKNRDIQTEPFTVVGVGDMSGDVFGNGMLLSEQTRLIAAFDHRDIFIDPNPDAAVSFAERRRLFQMPRSSWQDYDRTKLSVGGMIVPRTQKSVVLSDEAAAALGLPRMAASPVQIMKAILKADVDLLWFGGIGTYVKASGESNQDAGDRANDAIRVDAADLRAKVIGEGANLGVTQRGRIEYGLRGGACNSDAIDNSGGVNSSDVEVNIKIALASAMRGGRLTRASRDELLETMTQDVASLVLENNYQQTLALSLQQHRGLADLPHQARFMTSLEARGLLDRAVEFLPSDAALAERQARGEALTRAELGVLLAYAKIALMIDLVDSDIPDDPYFERGLLAYFPEAMRDKYAAEIAGHRLRREIIARQVANDLVNRGGPTFVSRLQDATGRTTADVVRTFVIVRDGFALDVLYRGIDALDTRIDAEAQLDLYAAVGRVLFDCTGWSLKNDHSDDPVGDRIAVISAARSVLGPRLRELMPDDIRARLERRQERYLGAGAPPKLAEGIALTMAERLVPGVAHVARQAGVDMVAAARAFYSVADAFRLSRIEEGARSIAPTDYYDGLALGRALDMLDSAARAIAAAALVADGGDDPVARWLDAGGTRVAGVRERLRALTESGDISVSRLSVAAGLMHDLAAS